MILCLDFDGVINPYTKGWQGGVLYEEDVTPGFWDWANDAYKLFDLYVYSSRSKTQLGIDLMRCWMAASWMKWAPATPDAETIMMTDFTFAAEKPPAFLTIDDRAITFKGSWRTMDPVLLRNFKPWNVE